MAVSIDAVVGQRAIDAANNEGADIEGVTSSQGTPVSPVEQQVTFKGYPNQIGPSLIANQGLINQGTTTNVIDIIDSLHPDFVANASPAELDYAVSVVQGKVDYGVTETITPEVGAIEIQNREIQAQNEELDRLISQLTLENAQARQQIRRASVSPWMAEAKLGPPIGSGGDVGAYIEQQQMGMGPPMGWSAGPYGTMATEEFDSPTALAGTSVQEGLGTGFAPDFFSNEANWGAGSYLPSGSAIKDDPLGKIIVSKGAGVPINTLEAWQDLVENTNQAWDYRGGSAFDYEKVTGKKDTGKTKYGTWNGKFNKETAEHNTAAKLAHDKAWLSDMKEWEKTASQKEINEMKRTDKYSKVYGSVYGIHPALKFVGGAMSSGLGIVGPALQGMLTKKGLGNADEFETTLKNMKAGEYKYEGEGGQQSVSEQAKEGVSGGFWGLMSFAKKNPKIFGTLSGDELWSLVSDPDGFWKFYEAALVGE